MNNIIQYFIVSEVLFVGLLIALSCFALQLCLCIYAKARHAKLVLVYICAAYVLCTLIDSFIFALGQPIVFTGFYIEITACYMTVSLSLAWIVYYFVRKKNHKQTKEGTL